MLRSAEDKQRRIIAFLSKRGQGHRIPQVAERIGLGDVVHAIAQPIAKAIDSVAHTNIQDCGGCKKRREMLNRIRL